MKAKILLPLLLVGFTCASCSHGKQYAIEDYRTTMQFHDNFRVMQLTDLHLGVQGDLKRNLDFVSKLIDDAQPDLIVISGDSFMYGTKSIVKNYNQIRLSIID